MSSVANEYSGYCATAEEYGRQHYEGGHTLYGPKTQPFLAAHAARLAGETVRAGLVADVPPSAASTCATTATCPRPTGGPSSRRCSVRPPSPTPPAATDGYWEQRWLDVAPGDLDWHEPLVRVETSRGDADGDGVTVAAGASRRRTPVDDQGWDLEVIHLGPDDRRAHRYGCAGGTPRSGQRPPPPLRAARQRRPPAGRRRSVRLKKPRVEARAHLRAHRPVGVAAIRLRLGGVGRERSCRRGRRGI